MTTLIGTDATGATFRSPTRDATFLISARNANVTQETTVTGSTIIRARTAATFLVAERFATLRAGDFTTVTFSQPQRAATVASSEPTTVTLTGTGSRRATIKEE